MKKALKQSIYCENHQQLPLWADFSNKCHTEYFQIYYFGKLLRMPNNIHTGIYQILEVWKTRPKKYCARTPQGCFKIIPLLPGYSADKNRNSGELLKYSQRNSSVFSGIFQELQFLSPGYKGYYAPRTIEGKLFHNKYKK